MVYHLEMTNHDIDAAIAKEEAENQRLRARLAESNSKLKVLREARRVLRGEMPSKTRMTIADVAEDILRKANKPLHMDDLLKAVRRRSGYEHLAKESLTTALWRLAKKNRRFRNVGPNTFELLKLK